MNSSVHSIQLGKKYLLSLTENKNSCVTIQKSEHHLTLHPFHLNDCKNSVKSILNGIIAKYDKSLNGIVLGYQNVKLLSDLGELNLDSAYIHVNIEAEFFVFKPVIGKKLHGVVNKKSRDHVGCLVHKTFNVSIPKPDSNSDDSEWLGRSVQIGSEIVFKITHTNFDLRLPYIKGVIVSIVGESDSGISTNEEDCETKRTKHKNVDSSDEFKQENSGKKRKKHRHDDSEEPEEENCEKKRKRHKHDDDEEEPKHKRKKTSI